MKKIDKTFLCLFLAELCEILVFIIQIVNKQGNLWLTCSIIFVNLIYIIGMKNNKNFNFKVVGENLFPISYYI